MTPDCKKVVGKIASAIAAAQLFGPSSLREAAKHIRRVCILPELNIGPWFIRLHAAKSDAKRSTLATFSKF